MADVTAGQVRQAVVATGRSLLGLASYSNAWYGATLSQFIARGAGDCSDFTQAIYGAHGIQLGAMSYEQSDDGVRIARWSGPRGQGVAAFNQIRHLLEPADLIVMSLDHRRPSTISHVQANIDGWNALDHGNGIGPKIVSITGRWLIGDATIWEVRRVIPDDEKAAKESEKRMGMTKQQAAQLADLHKWVKSLDQTEARITNMHTWLKTLDQTESKIDQLYGRRGTIDKINQVVVKQEAQAAAIEKLAEGQGIGGDQVTAAINQAVSNALSDIKITLEAKGL